MPALQLVRPGGVIAFDNVLWKGRVTDPDTEDKHAQIFRKFNADLVADTRISLSILPVGDGLALCTKL